MPIQKVGNPLKESLTGVTKLLRSLSSVQRLFAALVVVAIASAVAVPAFLLAGGNDKPPAEATTKAAPKALGAAQGADAESPAPPSAVQPVPVEPADELASTGLSIACPAYGEGTGDTTKRCTVKSRGGFSGTVTFSCTNNSPGIGCRFEPPTAELAAGGSAVSKFTFKPENQQLPNGTRKFYAVASSGAVSSRYALSWTTANSGPGYYGVNCPGRDPAQPIPNTVRAGGQTEVVCRVESMYGFSGPVSLECVPDMRNVSCAGTANPVTPPPHGSVAVGFRVAVPKENQAGNYRFVINRSAPGAEPVQRIPFVFYVRVTRPTLDVSCSPQDLVVQQATVGTIGCRLESPDGFDEEASLNLDGGVLTGQLSRQTARAGDAFQIRFEPSTTTPPGRYTYYLLYGSTDAKLYQGTYTVVAAPPAPIG